MSVFRDTGPQAALLPDGKRLHLHHGPIDLIIEATGSAEDVAAAYLQARRAFETVLETLVSELSILRTPADAIVQAPAGPVARRMLRAVSPHAKVFVTPMAAVAGAVADHILSELRRGRILRRAYVNNGGDIALFLDKGESFTVGVAASEGGLGKVTVHNGDPIRGIATSGWRGRSHSLGVADAVTVLAECAAAADAAATLIANAVDLPGAPAIRRVPARALASESDLGDRLVTVEVGPLNRDEKAAALDRGAQVAQDMRRRGLIVAAHLCLQGETQTIEHVDPAGSSLRGPRAKRLVHA
ncbi:MAG TPA: UPF0280 family protein [Kiloniellales bacterium]|jgi:hypothetical protein